MALDYLCLCECLRRGYDEVDFLAGDGEHKRRLATDESELAWVVWRRANLKNTLIKVLRRIKTSFSCPGPLFSPSKRGSSRLATMLPQRRLQFPGKRPVGQFVHLLAEVVEIFQQFLSQRG